MDGPRRLYSLRKVATPTASGETGTALLLAGGFELLQTHTFALDAQLRIGTVSYDNETISNVSLGLGFNWY
jgi:hypothetical protein